MKRNFISGKQGKKQARRDVKITASPPAGAGQVLKEGGLVAV